MVSRVAGHLCQPLGAHVGVGPRQHRGPEWGPQRKHGADAEAGGVPGDAHLIEHGDLVLADAQSGARGVELEAQVGHDRAGEVERREGVGGGTTDRDEGGAEPVGLAHGIAQHPAGADEAGEDGVAGRLVDREAAGELGQRHGLVGVCGERRDGGDDAVGGRGDPGHGSECHTSVRILQPLCRTFATCDDDRTDSHPGGPMHELVIRGGTLVDGTGAPPRPADVAVDDGVITEVADPGSLVDATTTRTVDADGLLVTPGFVDLHTHYDGQVTWDPLLTPSCWHGVTTVVMGNCGVGFAPVRPGQEDWLIQLMEGVEDIPGTALNEGITWGWETFPEYLDALDTMPRDHGRRHPGAARRACAPT